MNFNVLILFLLLAAACREVPVGGATADNRMKENNDRKSSKNVPDNRSVNQPAVELSKILTVTYCDLIRQPVRYDRKVVRVRAVYYTAFEKMYLYDERCETNQPPAAPEKVPAEIWAENDKSFVSRGDSDEAKLNRELNGFGRKDATLIGIFSSTRENPDAPNRFGHLSCCRYLFRILRVEKVTSRQDD